MRTIPKTLFNSLSLAVMGVLLGALVGCAGPGDDASEPAAPDPVAVVPPMGETSVPPAEDPVVMEARACVEGSWIADNVSHAAIMFELGAIAKEQIAGVWRLTAQPEGMLVSEFIGWSYDVMMPGPLGSPMVPITVTDNSTTIGHYDVQPDGSIVGTLDRKPTDDTAAPEPLVLRCSGDTLTHEVHGGTAIHVRES